MDYFAAFETLELPSDASPKQIRSAYRRLALQWHPDKNPDRRAMAEERFKADAFDRQVVRSSGQPPRAGR